MSRSACKRIASGRGITGRAEYNRTQLCARAHSTPSVFGAMTSTDTTRVETNGKPHDKQFLSCGICHQRYRSPKVLPCLHTFCASCLMTYVPEESLSMTCPTCRQQSIVPKNGVAALQNNFFVSNLINVLDKPISWCEMCQGESETSSTSTSTSLRSASSLSSRATARCSDCDVYVCDRCTSKHEEQSAHTIVRLTDVSMSDASLEDGEQIGSTSMMTLVCPNHDGKELDYYCSTCETAVCQACTTREHGSHPTVPAQEAIQEHKSLLNGLVQSAQTRVDILKDAVSTVQKVNAQLEDNFQEAQECTQETFQMLNAMLDERKTIVLAELEAAFKSKERTLDEQLKMLEATLNTVHNYVEVTENAVNRGSDTEILLVRKEMTEKLTQLATAPQDVQEVPEENGFLTFNTSDLKSAKSILSNLGCVQTNSAVSFETTATGDGLKRCEVDLPASVTITTKNRKGDAIKVGHSSFTCELSPIETNADGNSPVKVYASTVPEVLDNKNGTYDLTYIAENSGIYSLDIRLYGQPIKGSPFKIKATGSSINHTNGRTTPVSSSTLSISRIPKTSTAKQRGTKRPSSSRSQGSHRRSNPIEDDLMTRLGVKGRNKGEFTNPQGVCCYEGRVLVADSNNQCIQSFNPENNGAFKMRFGQRGRHAGDMQRPIGIAVTLNKNFLVTDFENRWVSIFNAQGKYVTNFGSKHLLGPKGVCIDKNGNIIVVDNRASCVFVFRPTGKLLHKFGSRGNEEYQFAGPHFCAVNSGNDIFVSDFHNHCVKVFDSEGVFKFSFGSNGEGNGQFNAPTGVAVDKHDNILVADWGNSRIQVSTIFLYNVNYLLKKW